MTASGGYVYFTSEVPGGRAAFRVPNAGGPSEWLGNVGANGLFLARDGTGLYFTATGSFGAAGDVKKHTLCF